MLLESTYATYLFGTFVSLFVMVDPFAVIPLYLVLTERFTQKDAAKIRTQAILVALALVLAFALIGVTILNFFGISISALRIAGGLLLLKLGLEQVEGTFAKIDSAEEYESLHRDNIAVVPLAMPMLAGPGALSTVVVNASRANNWVEYAFLIFTIVLVFLVSDLILRASRYFYKVLGKTGINLLGKIMGVLVVSIAIEFIITGLRDVFPKLWQT